MDKQRGLSWTIAGDTGVVEVATQPLVQSMNTNNPQSQTALQIAKTKGQAQMPGAKKNAQKRLARIGGKGKGRAPQRGPKGERKGTFKPRTARSAGYNFSSTSTPGLTKWEKSTRKLKEPELKLIENETRLTSLESSVGPKAFLNSWFFPDTKKSVRYPDSLETTGLVDAIASYNVTTVAASPNVRVTFCPWGEIQGTTGPNSMVLRVETANGASALNVDSNVLGTTNTSYGIYPNVYSVFTNDATTLGVNKFRIVGACMRITNTTPALTASGLWTCALVLADSGGAQTYPTRAAVLQSSFSAIGDFAEGCRVVWLPTDPADMNFYTYMEYVNEDPGEPTYGSTNSCCAIGTGLAPGSTFEITINIKYEYVPSFAFNTWVSPRQHEWHILNPLAVIHNAIKTYDDCVVANAGPEYTSWLKKHAKKGIARGHDIAAVMDAPYIVPGDA